MSQTQGPGEPAKKPRRTRASALSYHARRCSICRHPEREWIDMEFLQWSHSTSIASAFQIDRRSIYRHAHATGLFRQRNRDVRFALGRIIEQVQNVQPTADSIVRAVRLFACLTDDGELIHPPKVVIHHSAAPPPDRSSRGGADGERIGPPPARSAQSVSRDGSATRTACTAPADSSRLPDASGEANSSFSGTPRRDGTHPGNAGFREGRSTHPVNLNGSQVIENTAQRPAQIDTLPHA